MERLLALLLIAALFALPMAGFADELELPEGAPEELQLDDIELSDEIVEDGDLDLSLDVNLDLDLDLSLPEEEAEVPEAPEELEEPVSDELRENDGDFPKVLVMGVGEIYWLGYQVGMKYWCADQNIVTVSLNGKITAKKTGGTMIIVWKDNAIFAKCYVTVKKQPSLVTLSRGNAWIYLGASTKLEAAIPKNSFTRRYTWSSSNPQVAKVSQSGWVTAVGVGQATITVKTGNGMTAQCKVTVLRFALDKYMRSSPKSLVRKMQLKWEQDITYENGVPLWESKYDKLYSDGTDITCFAEVGKYITNISFSNARYSIDNIYVSLSRADAIRRAKNRGYSVWTDSDGDIWVDKGMGQKLLLVMHNNKVTWISAYADEYVSVIHPEWTDPEGEYHPETEFAYDMYSKAKVGDTGTLKITANADWKLSQQEETVSGWLSVSPQSGKAGNSTIKLTVNQAPEAGATYMSKLVLTTDTGRQYDTYVWLSKDSEDGSGDDSDDDVQVTDVNLDAKSLVLKVSEQWQLGVTVLPDNASDKNITWQSSDENIASVDEDGLVVAKAAGEATIYAIASNGLWDFCVVTVEPSVVELDSVTMSNTSVSLKVGESTTLTAKPFPSDATLDGSAAWSSNNTAVATVDKNGKVTAKGKGTAVITARLTSALGTKKTGTCSVTVTDDTCTLSLSGTIWKPAANGASVSVTVNSDAGFSYNVEYAGVSDQEKKTYDYQWLTLTKGNGKLELKARANYAAKSRKATITVWCTNHTSIKKTITVTQAANTAGKPTATVSLSPNPVNAGSSVTVNVTYSNARRLFVDGAGSVSSNPAAKTVAFSSTKKTASFTLNIPSDRSGDYSLKVYASNSNVTNDLWAQKATVTKTLTVNRKSSGLVSTDAPTLTVSTGSHSGISGNAEGGNRLFDYYLTWGDILRITVNTTNCGRVSMFVNLVGESVQFGNGSVAKQRPSASDTLELAMSSKQQPGVYEVRVYASNSTIENDESEGVKKTWVRFYIYVHGDGNYNPDAAASYAQRWVNDMPDGEKDTSAYNPGYYDWSGYGDCANFVSQCLFAGGLKPNTKWGVNIPGPWRGSVELYDYLSDLYPHEYKPKISQLRKGDVIFCTGSNKKATGHVMIVTGVASNGKSFTYCGHTQDSNTTSSSAAWVNYVIHIG